MQYAFYLHASKLCKIEEEAVLQSGYHRTAVEIAEHRKGE